MAKKKKAAEKKDLVEIETTETEPETTEAEPETTETEPETTETEPETTEAEPETTEAEPETTEAEPETTEAEPEKTKNKRYVATKVPMWHPFQGTKIHLGPPGVLLEEDSWVTSQIDRGLLKVM